MNKDQREIARKLRIIPHADQTGYVPKTCRCSGIGRCSSSRWQAVPDSEMACKSHAHRDRGEGVSSSQQVTSASTLEHLVSGALRLQQDLRDPTVWRPSVEDRLGAQAQFQHHIHNRWPAIFCLPTLGYCSD